MSKDDSLRDLIERVERSEGPDRELDCRIWCAFSNADPLAFFETCRSVVSDFNQWQASRCTASIDSAMTLVPEGWTRDIRDADNGDCLALLEREGPDRQEYSRAKTWPLAIVAASLRAHMETGG